MLKRMIVLALSLVLAPALRCDGHVATINQVQYRIGAGDTLRLTVFREESLSGEFQVGETGTLNLPLVGDIQASGKTIPEFRTDLTALLGQEFVRDPNVTVAVVKYRPVYCAGRSGDTRPI